METTVYAPIWIVEPTVNGDLSNWYDVGGSAPGTGVPVVALVAVGADGASHGALLPGMVEIELPGGVPVKLGAVGSPAPGSVPSQNFLVLNFPCRWRINKSQTTVPVGVAAYGYGTTNTSEN